MEPIINYAGKYITMKTDNGYEYVTRTNSHGIVMIVAITKDNELVLVSQKRIPIGDQVLEAPAGLVDTNETMTRAAERELLEETGYAKGQIRAVLNDVTISPGVSNEKITIVVFDELEKTSTGGGLATEGENITVHVVKREDISTFIKGFKGFVDLKLYTALYFYELYAKKDAIGQRFADMEQEYRKMKVNVSQKTEEFSQVAQEKLDEFKKGIKDFIKDRIFK
jgi:ADP-ribose pyrophosphatase